MKFISLILTIFIFCNVAKATETETNYKEIFDKVHEYINENYPESINEKELYESAIKGMLQSLDPYSVYMNEEESKKFFERSDGSFAGIGTLVDWDSKNKTIKIIKVLNNSPALTAGLKNDDIIFQIDGAETNSLNLQSSIDRLKGPVGSLVHLKALRDTKVLEIDVKRDIVKFPNIRSNIYNNIGYIKIEQFTKNISFDFYNEFNKINKTSLGGLVIDLRDNPGGLVNEAITISDMFLNEGIIVKTKPKNSEEEEIFYPTDELLVPSNFPLVILVNSRSASASEIVAGTLKDHGRAILVGTKTYGKGSVQTLFKLPNNSFVKMTIAKYFTASGTSPHKIGVLPTVEVEMPKNAEYGDITTDTQLQESLEIINELSYLTK